MRAAGTAHAGLGLLGEGAVLWQGSQACSLGSLGPSAAGLGSRSHVPGAGGQHRRGQLAPRGPSCLSQGGRRAAFHSKGAAWGPPAPDPRTLAVEIQVAGAGRQPRAAPRRLQGSLGSSASCPGHSVGSVGPAPSQFLEQTEVSTTDLQQPAQSAVGTPRTVRGGSLHLGVWAFAHQGLGRPCHGPGVGENRGQVRGHGQGPPCGRRGSGDSTADVEGSTGVCLTAMHGGQGGTRAQEPPRGAWPARAASVSSPPNQSPEQTRG